MTDQTPQTATPADQPDVADPIKAVATDLNISLPTIYREISLGRLRMSKIGNRSVIFRSDRKSYVQLLKDEADTRLAEKKFA